MTKRRPSNKKPTGLNKHLGNSLSNERDKKRRSHQRAKYDGNDIENPAFLEVERKKYIDSITDETSLEEFLSKAQLAGTEFTAEREQYRVFEKDSSLVIPTVCDLKNNLELQKEFQHRLRIPRRPPRDTWETVEELTKLENESFLKWRTDLAELQEVDGLVLTPFERNPDMWRELWRVIERSDIIIQIVDARNPLLFYSKDLDGYINEVDPAKQTMLLINKADLLETEQLALWASYFKEKKIRVVFWSALSETTVIPEEEENSGENGCDDCPGPSSELSSAYRAEYLHKREDLISLLKNIGHVSEEHGAKKLIVGMVGYPNVGKSSTINKLAGGKKVSVSATPGKTRHFQTIHIDDQLCLCDCPGLVMPSFTFGRDEMFLNGILPVSQMREHFGPVSLLLSRIPSSFLEKTYSLMLPANEEPSAVNFLTSLAFMRGFMSASGIPDCSRAARILLNDVVSGRVRWIRSPPGVDQHDFDQLMYDCKDIKAETGRVQLEQLEKRGLLEGDVAKNRQLDSCFFNSKHSGAHIKSAKQCFDIGGSVVPKEASGRSDKHHNNRNKKEKIRRNYVPAYY